MSPEETARTDAPRLEENLRTIDKTLEDLLENMPDSGLEARRVVTQVLGVAPSAEMLQTLRRMAEEEAESPLFAGPEREIVVTRLLADLTLRDATERRRLDPDQLHQTGETLVALVDHVKTLRRELLWMADDLSPRAREQIDKVQRTLMPSLELLEGWAALVPKVERLTRLAAAGKLSEVSYLTPEEAAFFIDADGGDVESDSGPARVWLDAAALRSSIEEDLETWDQFRCSAPDGSTGNDRPDEDDAEMRVEVLERLKADVSAYRVLLERLQQHHDAARAAGLDPIAAKSAVARKNLFASYRRLAPILRDPDASIAAGDDKTPEVDAAECESLLQAVDEADRAASPPSETQDELYIRALTDVRDGPATQDISTPGEAEPGAEKRRVRTLLSIAAVLAVIALGVNLVLLLGGSADAPSPPMSVAEFAPQSEVRQIAPVGSILYAQLSSFVWDTLNEDERLQRVNELAGSALDRGFTALTVADENGRTLAEWTQGDGVALPEHPDS